MDFDDSQADCSLPATTAYVDETVPAGKWIGRRGWQRLVGFGLLPVMALGMTLGVGYLKWQEGSEREAREAALSSVQAATDGSIAMLSYSADTVDTDLAAARPLLTGGFREEYTKLINDIVIPGARQRRISATAKVPGAVSLSATADHAVVLVFINQTTTVAEDAPTDTASTVRVTLDKDRGKWLISQFEPV
jgi:Mce-associated membrane protein